MLSPQVSLTPQARLGPYEILGLIGAGGMGEVYKARDTRLDRTVAIKVLHRQLATEPDYRVRLEQEAKSIGALAHPHICTLHDVGEHAGTMFLVMEHLEGETLAKRLERGPVPVHEAVAIAFDIADALASAHRHGIVHRDLKPANVMLTKRAVKLLDFGLAKLTGPSAHAVLEDMPTATRSAPLTAEGVIAGTLQYMAPEQLEGKPADGRSDLWALGAILYEMLAGRRAFSGESAARLVGSIVEREPAPLPAMQPLTPPAVDALVRQCLAKAPEDRPDTAHDVALQLRWMRESTAETYPKRRPRPPFWIMATVAVGLLAAGVIVGSALSRLREPPPPAARPTVFAISPPAGDVLLNAVGITVAPDGSRLAYGAIRNGVRQLFVRSIDSLEILALEGTENAEAPFFSPDGRWLGYFADEALKKIPVGGGTPITICAAGYRRGASWTTDDVIIFGSDTSRGLMRVSAAGGAPVPLTVAGENQSHRWPEALPGGKGVIYTTSWFPQKVEEMKLAVFDIASGSHRELFDGSFPRFVQPDYLTFVRDGSLWVTRFDPAELAVIGEPMRTALIPAIYVGGFAEYGIGQDGTLAMRPPESGGELTWVDRAGQASRISERTGLTAPRISPDGRLIAAVMDGALWVHDLVRDTWTQTMGVDGAGSPEWSIDGRHLMFTQGAGLHTVAADGSAPPVRLSPAGTRELTGAWHPKGVTRTWARRGGATNYDIWVETTPGQAAVVVATPERETSPAFSPDGRWIAYNSGQIAGPTSAVFVQGYPAGDRLRVSPSWGGPPRWTRDGRELLFVAQFGEMVSVPVDPGSREVFGRPRVLFRGSYAGSFDVDLDGRRFVMVTRVSPPGLTVMVNWLEGIRSKLPH